MPTGWFIVQPPSSGTQTARLSKVSPTFESKQSYDGSIGSISLKKAAVALAGWQAADGPMNVALKKLAISMSGEENTLSDLAVRLPKLSADFEQDLFTGAVFSTLKPAQLAFALQTQGAIETRLADIDTLIETTQAITGDLGARLAVARHIIAGAHSQDGVLTTAVKKVSADAAGYTPVPEFVSSAYANSTTVAMPTHQAGDYIVIMASRVGSATPALQAGWTNIVNGNRAVGTGNWSARVAYKVAASSSETTGTWATSEDVLVVVYRNVSAIGAATTQIGAGNTTVTWPAATLLGTNEKSRILRFGRGGGAASLTTDLLTNQPIAGYAIREGNDRILAIESGLVSSNPVAQTQVTTSTNYWYTVTIELRSN